MIKFQFFEKSSSLNCHFKNLGTYVVSIAHYMRAYFNYQALTHGNDFSLPGDVGFLNVSLLFFVTTLGFCRCAIDDISHVFPCISFTPHALPPPTRDMLSSASC